MAVWTNGTARILVTPRGIARGEGGAYEVTPNLPAGRKRAEALEDVDLFVVADAGGEVALVRQRGQGLRVWRRGEGFEPCDTDGRNVESLVAVRPNLLVAVVADARGRALVRASLEGRALRLADAIALPKAPRLTTVDAFFGEEPWAEVDADGAFEPTAASRAHPDGHLLGEVRLVANHAGLAVTSTYSGLVAVLAPDTLAPRCAVMFPTRRQQFDLHAVPLAEGAFVTVVVNGRHSLHLNLGADGVPVATRKAFGKEEANGEGPALLLGKRLLVNQGREGGVQQLALPDLKAKLYRDGVRIDTWCTSSDGAAHLVELSRPTGEAREWKLLRDGAKLSTEECEAPPFTAAEEPAAPSLPKVTGPVNLGVAALPGSVWTLRAGEVTTLSLNVMNRGGPAKGLYVEVGGAALTSGLVEPVSATLDGVKGSLAPRAELDVSIEAATAPQQVKGPPQAQIPPPSVRLDLEVRGKAAGNAILTVRVGPLPPGSPGSAMCGRPLDVSA